MVSGPPRASTVCPQAPTLGVLCITGRPEACTNDIIFMLTSAHAARFHPQRSFQSDPKLGVASQLQSDLASSTDWASLPRTASCEPSVLDPRTPPPFPHLHHLAITAPQRPPPSGPPLTAPLVPFNRQSRTRRAHPRHQVNARTYVPWPLLREPSGLSFAMRQSDPPGTNLPPPFEEMRTGTPAVEAGTTHRRDFRTLS